MDNKSLYERSQKKVIGAGQIIGYRKSCVIKLNSSHICMLDVYLYTFCWTALSHDANVHN